MKLAPLVATCSLKFLKIFSTYSINESYLAQAHAYRQNVKALVLDFVKKRLDKVHSIRERAADRLRLAKELLKNVRVRLMLRSISYSCNFFFFVFSKLLFQS